MTQKTKVRTPVALASDPIIEATFEVRFVAKQPQLAELLPGLLYPALRDQFPAASRLPAADLPRGLRQSDPALAYVPVQQLEGETKRVLIGDRSVALAQSRPYPGWSSMRPIILQLTKALNETALIGEVERFSLRYLNVITHGDLHDLSMFKLRVEVDELRLRGPGFQLQIETERDKSIVIVQLQSGTTVALTTPKGTIKHTGVMLAVDTVRLSDLSNFWTQIPEFVDEVHTAAKDVFFSLLTENTLEALGPRWE